MPKRRDGKKEGKRGGEGGRERKREGGGGNPVPLWSSCSQFTELGSQGHNRASHLCPVNKGPHSDFLLGKSTNVCSK